MAPREHLTRERPIVRILITQNQRTLQCLNTCVARDEVENSPVEGARIEFYEIVIDYGRDEIVKH